MKRERRLVRGVQIAILTIASAWLAAVSAFAGNALEVGPGHTYATIQAAANAAQSGDAVLVYPGQYPESVTVRKNYISFLAQGDGVIVGPPPQEGEACFDVRADGVVIHGFELTGTNCAPAIHFLGSHNRFSKNQVYGLTCPGVNALECRDPDGGSNYNIIEDNDVTEADLGIIVGSDSNSAVNKGNVIAGNFVHGVGAVGIGVYNGVDTTITGNTIMYIPFGWGISVSTPISKTPQQNIVVTANKITDVAEGGIGIFADAKCNMKKIFVGYNEISSTGGYGILLQLQDKAKLSDCTLSGNTVKEADHMGIVVDAGVEKNTLEGNLTVGNGEYGILVIGKNNTLEGNTSMGNGTCDMQDRGKNNTWKDNVYQTSACSH